MGYWTDYYLRATGYPVALTDDEAEELENAIKLRVPVEPYGGNIGASNWSGSWQIDAELNAKWYGFDKDMVALSLNYPNVLFELEGNGEEQDDRWQYYYYAGKVQRDGIVISFNRFDISKLEPTDYYEEVPSLASD